MPKKDDPEARMVACKNCGVYNDPKLRDKCWKCKATLPPPDLPLMEAP